MSGSRVRAHVFLPCSSQIAFDAFRFTFVALYALLVLVFAGAVVEFWGRKVRSFPRLNREQVGLSMGFVASVLELVFWSWNPFRFVSIAEGALSPAVRVGTNMVSNLALSCTGIGWVMVLVMWVHVRSPLMGQRGRWEGIMLRIFVLLVCTTLAMGAVCAGLTLVIYSTADSIFFVYLGTLGETYVCRLFGFRLLTRSRVAFLIGVVILTSASLTYRQLTKFRARHEAQLTRLAVHMIVTGTVILLVIVVLLVLTLLPSANASFGAFLGFRCWFTASVHYAAVAVIWFVLRFRRWKESGNHYRKDEGEATATTSLSLVPDSASHEAGIETEFAKSQSVL